jgi:hypothetical protein
VSEEKAFLAPFFAQAQSGEIATVAQIQRANARQNRTRGR